MSRYRSRILVIAISFLLLAAWFASLFPAASPLAAGVIRRDATQSVFVDSGQELGGDVESSAVALGDLDADNDLDAYSANGTDNKVWVNQGGAQGGVEGVFRRLGRAGSRLTCTAGVSIVLLLGL